VVNAIDIFRPLSLWRIVAAAVLAFALIGLTADRLLPDLPVSLINLGMSQSDPRVVQRNISRNDGEFFVTWVIDSSPNVLKRQPTDPNRIDYVGRIDDEVTKLLPVVDNRKLRFGVFLQSFGAKAIDKLYTLQYAVDTNPDLVIYGVNPTFDFTPWNMMASSHVAGGLATYSDLKSSKWALMFASPAELLEGLAGRFLPAVRDRFDFGTSVDRLRVALDPFHLGAASKPLGKPAWSPLFARGFAESRMPPFDPRVDSNHLRAQRLAMRYMDLGPSSWGKAVVTDVIERLKRANQRSIVYIIPLNIEAIEKDPGAAEKFHEFEKWFSQLALETSDEFVTVIPRTPTRDLAGLEFHDISHLTKAEPFIEFLSKEIAKSAQTRK
jgi:hypothetical protein